jgi:O-antigen/teichoic acid export membrane protein
MAIIPLIFLSFLIMALLKYSGVDFNKILISGAVAISLAGLLFREFLRGYFFADENPLKVIKMDALYAGLITLFSLITYMIFEIKTFIIFILIGLSAFIAAFLFFKNQKWTYDQNSIKKCYGENWRFGKWALLGVLVTHTQNYSYVYLLGAMLGSVAVADVSAARFLLMPLILVEAGWGKIAIPHGSKLREQEKFNALLKLQITASLIFTVGIAFYVTLLLTFFDVLEAYLLTDKYTASRQYIIYWGVIFAIRFLTLNASYGLQITKNFDLISKVNFLTMLITVGCAYLFINSYGIRGGLVALIIGGLLLAVALWFYFSKILISIIKGRAGSGIKKDFAFKLQK